MIAGNPGADSRALEEAAAARAEAEEERKARRRRIAALAAVALSLAAIVYVLFIGGEKYTVTAQFQNAAQLVTGNQVSIGGTAVGSVSTVELGPRNTALVELEIKDEDYTPLPERTIATIRSTSLSGIANRYVSLALPNGPSDTEKTIPDGGTLGLANTVSEVDLDELFNAFTPESIRDLKHVIQGFARSYDGIGPQTNRGFHYLNPFLSTSRDLFAELTRDERRFERLIVDTASLSGALAERAPDIEDLIGNLDRMMGAIAAENRSLARAVGDLPGFMREFNSTAVNLRATLDDLDPLVAASKPVAIKLRPFTRELRAFATDALPAIRDLDQITGRRGPDNDLVELTALQPALARIAVGPVQRNGKRRRGALPESVAALRASLPQLGFFRPYTPELLGWFDDFSHSGFADANGSFARQSVIFNAFTLDPATGLPQNLIPFGERGELFKAFASIGNTQRCPGANERDRDGSIPFTDPGGQPGGGDLDCDPTQGAVGP